MILGGLTGNVRLGWLVLVVAISTPVTAGTTLLLGEPGYTLVSAGGHPFNHQSINGSSAYTVNAPENAVFSARWTNGTSEKNTWHVGAANNTALGANLQGLRTELAAYGRELTQFGGLQKTANQNVTVSMAAIRSQTDNLETALAAVLTRLNSTSASVAAMAGRIAATATESQSAATEARKGAIAAESAQTTALDIQSDLAGVALFNYLALANLALLVVILVVLLKKKKMTPDADRREKEENAKGDENKKPSEESETNPDSADAETEKILEEKRRIASGNDAAKVALIQTEMARPETAAPAEEVPRKRKRGRPRKIPNPNPHANGIEITV